MKAAGAGPFGRAGRGLCAASLADGGGDGGSGGGEAIRLLGRSCRWRRAGEWQRRRRGDAVGLWVCACGLLVVERDEQNICGACRAQQSECDQRSSVVTDKRAAHAVKHEYTIRHLPNPLRHSNRRRSSPISAVPHPNPVARVPNYTLIPHIYLHKIYRGQYYSNSIRKATIFVTISCVHV